MKIQWKNSVFPQNKQKTQGNLKQHQKTISELSQHAQDLCMLILETISE